MKFLSTAVAPVVRQSCMHRNDKIFLPSKLRINTCIVIIFLFSILKMLSKETSLKTKVIVSPEKQLFQRGPANLVNINQHFRN